MTRTDDDSWDLASSVGATATMVAAGRAMATKDEHPLINDPFAEPLVRAVGLDFFVRMIDGDVDVSLFANSTPERMQAIVDGMGLRTKYFDDYLLAAVSAWRAASGDPGVRSGCPRLPVGLAGGNVVYEIDQPQVIEFKTRTLADLGAEPTATRRTVAIDLRGDWPAALKDAGLDTGAPTAWLAEGLLIYLPPEAQDRLFDNITAFSAPGSTVATEYVPGIDRFRRRPGPRNVCSSSPAGCRHRHALADLCGPAQPRGRISARQVVGCHRHVACGTVRRQRTRHSRTRERRSAGRDHLHQRDARKAKSGTPPATARWHRSATARHARPCRPPTE